jgi:hypothetical protein
MYVHTTKMSELVCWPQTTQFLSKTWEKISERPKLPSEALQFYSVGLIRSKSGADITQAFHLITRDVDGFFP